MIRQRWGRRLFSTRRDANDWPIRYRIALAGLCVLIGIIVACEEAETGTLDAADTNGQEQSQPEANETDRIVDAYVGDSFDGQGDQVDMADHASKEPVTITWMWAIGEADFKTFTTPIKERFPHLELVHVAESIRPDSIEEAVASGNVPDLITVDHPNQFQLLKAWHIDRDLDPFIEKTSFNLDRVEPNILSYFRTYSESDQLLGMPFTRAAYVTHYNRDIFDRFGTPYPEDDMTWSEVTALAESVSGRVDGHAYRGLDIDMAPLMAEQLGVYALDPETHALRLTEDDAYVRFFEQLNEIIHIPGNEPDDANVYQWGDAFAVHQNVAMLPMWNMAEYWVHTKGLNMDITTYPVWEEQPHLGPPSDSNALAISAVTDHADVVFDVIRYVLSDSFQLAQSRQGVPSPLVNPSIHDAFAMDVPELADIHTAAIFRHSPHPGPEARSAHEDVVDIWGAVPAFVEQDVDVDTFLVQLEEAAAQRLAERLAE